MQEALTMLTNEELAVMAKAGNEDALLVLWERNWPFYRFIMNRGHYRYMAKENRAVDEEDLKQAAFLGVFRGVGYYDPVKGLGWLTVAKYFVQNECMKLLGFSGRPRKEHYQSVSLSAPIYNSSESESRTVGDMLVDVTLPELTDRIEEQDAKKAIRAALEKLPQKEAAVVRECILTGHSIENAAKTCQLSVHQVRKYTESAIMRLGKNKDLQFLGEQRERTRARCRTESKSFSEFRDYVMSSLFAAEEARTEQNAHA